MISPAYVYWIHRGLHLVLEHVPMSPLEQQGLAPTLAMVHDYLVVTGQAFDCTSHLHVRRITDGATE